MRLSPFLLPLAVLFGSLQHSFAATIEDDGLESYIVTFHSLPKEKREEHHKWMETEILGKRDASDERGVKGHFHFGDDLSGYHGRFSKEEIEKIANSEHVKRAAKEKFAELYFVAHPLSSLKRDVIFDAPEAAEASDSFDNNYVSDLGPADGGFDDQFGGQPYPGDQPGDGSFPGNQPDDGSFPGDQPDDGSYPGDQPDDGSFPGDQPDDGSYPGDQPDDGSFPGDQPDDGNYPGDQPDDPDDQPGDQPDDPGDQPDDQPDDPDDQPGDQPDDPDDQPGDQPDDPDFPGDHPGDDGGVSEPDKEVPRDPEDKQGTEKQPAAPWALGIISHKSKTRSREYVYKPAENEQVMVYIMDAGCDEHSDYRDRLRDSGGDFYGADTSHATATCGIVGGERFGVAKEAELVSVRMRMRPGEDGKIVFTQSELMRGLQWIAEDYAKPENKKKKAVVNYSISMIPDPTFAAAINAITKQGVPFVCAAGNSHNNICDQYTLVDSEMVVIVGSIDSSYRRAQSSCYGPCVEVFAPGDNVVSTAGEDGQGNFFGTSFASPHVAGLIAYFWGQDNKLSPSEVITKATRGNEGKVLYAGEGSHNFLAYNGAA